MIVCFAFALNSAVEARGYLATRAEKLPALVLGTDEIGYAVSETEYRLETGNAYSLEITSTGAKECAWEAPDLANSTWLRKVEAGDVEITATHLYEIEFENEGEAEIFFVPIGPGEYSRQCRGLAEKRLTGKLIVE
ncbi:MAG: copper-binding protein [bacterium]|nr:copper-binding protein [bacterium]